MSISDVINKIKTRMEAVDPSGPRKVLAVFQLNIKEGDNTQNWIMDLKNLCVTEGVAESPDITVELDDETFIQLGEKQITLAEAEADGKASVSGDRSILAALTEAMK
ncbi:hypothetical protein HA402_002379 [Bradysia odoriphaga]|nr:hypothetical protein HA402_002379 [Bradysia odoriphaga]